MITPEQQKGLLAHIGARHISKVAEYFYQHMIFNRNGHAYHHNSISEVFNGRKENPKIEAGIWAFAEDLKKQKEKEAKRKAAILGIDNPVENE